MHHETAISLGFEALTFILSEDELKERFMALTGLSPGALSENIENDAFLASVLEFLIGHEPDLITYAEQSQTSPTDVVLAWRQLGGGVGQEW